MEGIQDLVARQVRKWELDRRISERFAQDEVAGAQTRNVITVSRDKASGGSEAAKLVARELGFDLYDREIIDAVAAKAHTDRRVVEASEERGPNLLRDILLGFLEGDHLTEAAYLRALVKVLRHIAREGNAVIIGRGASCVLVGSYRVRVTAPFELRAERVRELDGITGEHARRIVMESDRRRRDFVRGHFGCDPDDPLAYDLIINTEHTSIEHVAQLIIEGFRHRFTGSPSDLPSPPRGEAIARV